MVRLCVGDSQGWGRQEAGGAGSSLEWGLWACDGDKAGLKWKFQGGNSDGKCQWGPSWALGSLTHLIDIHPGTVPSASDWIGIFKVSLDPLWAQVYGPWVVWNKGNDLISGFATS